MSLEEATGYVAGAQDETAEPLFEIQKVQLRFDIAAEYVAAQVANNILVLALSTGRILRFDLENVEDVDDIDLPRRPAETGVIRKLFLDPSASHLLITTTLGETFYLHTGVRQPKLLPKLKNIQIESVAWNPARPTSSTREILLGAADGSVFETYIEPSTEFYRAPERYLKLVCSTHDGPVVGLHTEILSPRPDTRAVLVATTERLLVHVGAPTTQRHDGNSSVYAKMFESEPSTVHRAESVSPAPPSTFVLSPDANESTSSTGTSTRAWAWLCAQGVLHGTLLAGTSNALDAAEQLNRGSTLFAQSKLPAVQTAGGRARSTQPPISAITLTQFHILTLVEGRITIINRLDGNIVYNQQILESGHTSLGLFSDPQKNTYWLLTSQEIFEIVVTDESRDVWKILLKQGKYEDAQLYAKTPEQKNAVASTTGDYLVSQGRYNDAAIMLGKSTKAFEDVALTFIDNGAHDALRKYLLVKLSTFKKSSTMQRMMLASWLVELYMAKLNQLDDTLSTKAELSANGSSVIPAETQKELPLIRREYQDFVTKHKTDLDRKTIYEVISSHGREEELLFFANVVDDSNYVLSYWVQRERWAEAMTVLKRQTDPNMFYKYSTVLMAHVPVELVDVLTRQSDLDPKRIIPALLNYNRTIGSTVSLSENQAVRYLSFCINQRSSREAAVHNTLVSLYASHQTTTETELFHYLESQQGEPSYDTDFVLRLCIAHQRVHSAVFVYCTMQQYASAVDLALKYDDVDLAANVADRPESDSVLRKKLWLKVAKKVVERSKGIKAAIEFLRRAKVLRIQDIIPFFPDFVVIDDFKEEICDALEEYSRSIDELKREMDDSAATAQRIKAEVKALDQRYAIVEPGERCWKCRLPLLMRQFFVFPCQHSFHADCLGEMVMSMAGMGKSKRIRELQREVGRGVALGKRREGMVRELDGLVAGACVLCSEMAVKTIDEPFILATDDPNEWAI